MSPAIRLLKPLRVLFALLFFAATVALFLDLEGRIPSLGFEAVLWLQPVPSLVQFSHGVAWAATGFVLVLLSTLLFGRIFCSTICPLGTLQDLVSRISRFGRRNTKRVRYRFRPPWNLVRYGFLAVTLVGAVGGSLFVIGQLDPFSQFGRFMGLLVRPVFVGLNNLVARTLESMGSYAVAPLDFALAHWRAAAVPLLLLGLLVWMSARHGRLFCNSLCPVGTLLGLVARFALFRLTIDPGKCSLCAKCSVQCKAECIHLPSRRVDFDRCVVCFDCIPICPESGIRYRAAWRLQGEGCGVRTVPAPDDGGARRAFLKAVLAGGLSVPGIAGLSQAKDWPQNRTPTQVPMVKTSAAAPPGAGSVVRFNAACTACQLCVSVCPTQVLQPSLLSWGIDGLLQPHMAFEVAYCTYECIRCGEVCPTNAIRPLSVASKKTTKIGEARFIEENCIVVTEETACGACAEHCPTQAVHMVEYAPELTVPELDPDICVGCGACEHACPVRPHRAIYVDGEPVHRVAREPRGDTLQLAPREGFPF